MKPELLSPAGNFEKLRIALAYGADAVYAGVSAFSLRARSAKEFNYESYAEAVKYAHERGKRVYSTINAFPFNAQINGLIKHLQILKDIKPDAFIVAAPGVIKLCQQIAPEIPIHLSTQANVLNYLDAQVYFDMGVKRIVAAREMSLKDLIKIKEHLPKLELETFIHGSMCFAFSGRCLISAVQNGRVPNRGSCANDCRFAYEMYIKNEESNTLFKLEENEGGTYILNSKDLNLSSRLDEILQADIISALKIEGRTKSPYYVATTAKVYSQAIDDFYAGNFKADQYQKELQSTKNRGFTQGFLIKHPSEARNTQNHFSNTSDGTHQVYAMCDQSGEFFKAKDTIITDFAYEIFAPSKEQIKTCDNQIGKIYEQDGSFWLKLNKIMLENGKTLEAIHSGNTLSVHLPQKLPAFSFLRLPIDINVRQIAKTKENS